MTISSSFDHTKFKPSDLEKYFDILSNPSSSKDEVKLILKNLTIFVSESEDSVSAILGKGGVKILMNLYVYNSSVDDLKMKISNVLVLLGQRGNSNTSVVFDSLANISSNSDFNVFIECMEGIKEVATTPAEGRVSGGGSGGGGGQSTKKSSPTPPVQTHTLSISSACTLLSKMTSLLTSTTVKDGQKLEGLGLFMELVDYTLLNDAAEFSMWLQSNAKGSDKETPSQLFLLAFSAFSEALKETASVKKRTPLSITAEQLHLYIKEKRFFPTAVSVSIGSAASVPLPMKFMVNTRNTTTIITRTDTKVTWGNTNAWGNFVVDQEMLEGLYKLEIEADCSSNNMVHAWLMLCAKAEISSVSASSSGYNHAGVCSFGQGQMVSGSTSVYSGTVFSNVRHHLFGLELDVDKGVFSLFVDGAQVPHCFVNIPKSVYFAVCGVFQYQIYELKSFQKLTSPSTDPSLKCAQYAWR